MESIPVGISPEEEKYVNSYVNAISQTYFGKPYRPDLPLTFENLGGGVGGYTQSKCSLNGCRPYKIVLDRKFQEIKKFKELIVPIHEETHAAMIEAFPYLPYVWDTPLIEGFTIYTNIEKALEEGRPDLAKAYYEELSPQYRSFYHTTKYIDKLLKRQGSSIEEAAKEYNEYGKNLLAYLSVLSKRSKDESCSPYNPKSRTSYII